MKCKIGKKYIELFDELNRVKIIINYNDTSKDMVVNTICSINNFCKNEYDKNIIINFNRYNINNQIKTKFKINNPLINVYTINILNYIDSIKKKSIINISELDRMIIIFSSKDFKHIIQYTQENRQFYKLIIKLIT